MIFVGDIAFPRSICSSPFSAERYFGECSVIANLEGAILKVGSEPRGTELYNDYLVLTYLRKMNVRLVSLANNHILDSDSSPKATITALHEHDILSCGAGESLEDASRPVLLKDSEGDAVFLGFGWDMIGCRIASSNRPGVNPLRQDAVLDGIVKAKSVYPGKRIILLMHWNYELEIYPQPMHRQIAHMAIEYGASAVVGCHSHCVQGIEVYLGAPIVYGLGNWFFPEGQIFGRSVRFPDFALRQLAFDWGPRSGSMRCHWFSYNRQFRSVEYESSEVLQDSTDIKVLTPFATMNHSDYVKWFKKNRRKRILLPVYADTNHHLTNKLRNAWVRTRQALIGVAVAANMKKRLR